MTENAALKGGFAVDKKRRRFRREMVSLLHVLTEKLESDKCVGKRHYATRRCASSRAKLFCSEGGSIQNIKQTILDCCVYQQRWGERPHHF
jgi:hypothetical protein